MFNVYGRLGRARLQKDEHGSRVPCIGWLGKGDCGDESIGAGCRELKGVAGRGSEWSV